MRIVALTAGLVLLAGCSASARPAPATSTLRLPATTSVNASWFPGLNSASRAPVVDTGGATVARRLLHDLAVAPPIKPGPYSCPNDDGTYVDLSFAPHAETAQVQLSGCRFFRAPGGGKYRQTTAAIFRDLRPLAPAAFRHYVTY